MALYAIIMEAILRPIALRPIAFIGNKHYGFGPGKSTSEPIFFLSIIQEKYREVKKELHMVFVVHTTEFIWWSGRKVSLRDMLRWGGGAGCIVLLS